MGYLVLYVPSNMLSRDSSCSSVRPVCARKGPRVQGIINARRIIGKKFHFWISTWPCLYFAAKNQELDADRGKYILWTCVCVCMCVFICVLLCLMKGQMAPGTSWPQPEWSPSQLRHYTEHLSHKTLRQNRIDLFWSLWHAQWFFYKSVRQLVQFLKLWI